jgi:hypothetical protein
MGPEQAGATTTDGLQTAREPGSDLALATNIAQTVESVPGVRGLSAGCFATIATYGPGGRVPGIVLRRAPPDTLTVEVHLVASEEVLLLTLHRRSVTPPLTLPEAPFLLSLAEQVRTSIQQMLALLPLSQPVTVDVVIDDLR